MKPIVQLASLLLGSALLFSGCATSRPPKTQTPAIAQTPTTAHRPLSAQTPTSLIEGTARLSETHATRLSANYILATLKDHNQDTNIKTAFEQALASDTHESKLALLRALELKFIHDPKTSGLDVLGPELSHHFRDFKWHDDDFPGGAPGPNEQFADVMVDTLDLVRPERRANSTRDAVVLRAEATDPVWDYMTNRWVPVPGQERWKLNRHALDSFVRMREQAKRDDVDLIILSAHRYPQTAQRNAARVGNPNAVASFSSHSLGLAVDFKMSHRDDFKVSETATHPMSEVVRMRESPVHKWLLLRGEEFGWYPYQNEPWHWEYNPPGFGEIFWAEFPGGAPKREIIIDEP
jgi:hypothetical protein